MQYPFKTNKPDELDTFEKLHNNSFSSLGWTPVYTSLLLAIALKIYIILITTRWSSRTGGTFLNLQTDVNKWRMHRGKKRDQRLNVHKDIQQKCECVCEGVSKRPCTAQWLGCRPSHPTFKDQFNTRPIILIDRPLVIIVVLRLNHANFEEKWITAACPWPVQDTRTLWKHSWHPTLVGWT